MHIILWAFVIAGFFGYGFVVFYGADLEINGVLVFSTFGGVSFILLLVIHYRLRRQVCLCTVKSIKFQFLQTADIEENPCLSFLIMNCLNCCAYGQMGAFAFGSEELV